MALIDLLLADLADASAPIDRGEYSEARSLTLIAGEPAVACSGVLDATETKVSQESPDRDGWLDAARTETFVQRENPDRDEWW